jgi:hypothetical protein
VHQVALHKLLVADVRVAVVQRRVDVVRLQPRLRPKQTPQSVSALLDIMIFYLLHQWLPNTDTFKEGKRNCATFMYGAVIYAVLYAVLKNAQLVYGVLVNAALSAFAIIVAADACVMAYIYKCHYGRSILHELDQDQDQSRWIFDAVTHKYRRPTQAETYEKLRAEVEATQAKHEAEETRIKTREIVARKERIRAAKTIQRWWRATLYTPPHGILYKRALADFTMFAAHEQEQT